MVEVKGTPNHFKFGYMVDKVIGFSVSTGGDIVGCVGQGWHCGWGPQWHCVGTEGGLCPRMPPRMEVGDCGPMLTALSFPPQFYASCVANGRGAHDQLRPGRG